MRVFTDGASSPDGRGGWAWVAEEDFEIWGAGFDYPTTNQRMEVKAALMAVQNFPLGPLTVVSDSKYVVDCFNARWWVKWEKNGWRNAAGKEVANQDLWKPFIQVVKNHPGVIFTWIKGHSGHPANERADELAVAQKSLAATLVP